VEKKKKERCGKRRSDQSLPFPRSILSYIPVRVLRVAAVQAQIAHKNHVPRASV